MSVEPMPEDAGVTQMPGNVFFDQQRKLVTPLLGEVIRQAGHLRSGVDGRLWRYDGGVYRPDGDVFTRDQIRTLLGDECRRVHFDEVMTWLRSFPPTITGAVSTKYLNVTNGMLDWRTGELSEHDPEHCSTIQLPVAWNPEARCRDSRSSSASRCPKTRHHSQRKSSATDCRRRTRSTRRCS